MIRRFTDLAASKRHQIVYRVFNAILLVALFAFALRGGF